MASGFESLEKLLFKQSLAANFDKTLKIEDFRMEAI